MNGAAMASPSNARAASMTHLLCLLVLAPILVFFLVLLLGLLVGVLSSDSLHEHSWMPLAKTLSSCVSPVVLVWACLLYPESVDFFMYFPLLLALPILHAGAVRVGSTGASGRAPPSGCGIRRSPPRPPEARMPSDRTRTLAGAWAWPA